MILERDGLLLDFQEFALAAPAPESAHGAHRPQPPRKNRTLRLGRILVNPADSGILLVGSFVGSFTPNARIPLDTGLCGAAARTGQSVVVDDVARDPRYLSGS